MLLKKKRKKTLLKKRQLFNDYLRGPFFRHPFISNLRLNLIERPKPKKKVIGRDPIMFRLRGSYYLYNHYRRNRFFYRKLRYFLVDNFPDFIFFISLSFLVFFFIFFLFPLLGIIIDFFTLNLLIFFIEFFKSLFYFLFLTVDFSYKLILHCTFYLLKFLFSKIMLLQLFPEIILLITVFILLSLQSWANNHYNANFFKELLQKAFGLDRVAALESRSYEARSLNLSLIKLKHLYTISFSWLIAFIGIVLALLWLIFNTPDTISLSSSVFFESDQTLSSGLNDVFFGNHFYFDGFVFYSRFFILIISVIFLLIFKNELELDLKLQRVEFIVLILLGILFSMLMVSASSFLSLFLVIEGLVMIMYVMSAASSLDSNYPISNVVRFRSAEGSLKYVITNAVAGSFFLLGSLLVCLFTGGELYFINLNTILSFGLDSYVITPYAQIGIVIGLVFVACTFLFKIGSFPFHAWMADLYESATLGVLTFFVLIPKMAILLTLVNLYRFLFIHFPFIFSILFICIGFISLIVGAIMASRQVKISRLIAYSSVSQVGSLIILLALVSLSKSTPYALIMLFSISYGFVMSHFMSILSSIKRSPSLISFSSLKELSIIKTLPAFAQNIFATFVFNLAGMPPFLGWLLKSIVLVVALFLAFDSFYFSNFDNYSFSPLELSSLSFLSNLLSFDNYNSILNFSFIFLVILTLLIFLSLLVSIHYSIQLYKTTFSEFNNVPSDNLRVETVHTTSLLVGTLLFVIFLINFCSFFSIFGIFSWLQFVCFA